MKYEWIMNNDGNIGVDDEGVVVGCSSKKLLGLAKRQRTVTITWSKLQPGAVGGQTMGRERKS